MQTRPTGGNHPLPGEWERQGKCKEVGPHVMYPSADTGDQSRARAVCADCPVREACLLHAIGVNEQHGTWGGLGEEPRKRLRRYLRGHPGADLMTAVMATRTDWKPSPADRRQRVLEATEELRHMAAALA